MLTNVVPTLKGAVWLLEMDKFVVVVVVVVVAKIFILVCYIK